MSAACADGVMVSDVPLSRRSEVTGGVAAIDKAIAHLQAFEEAGFGEVVLKVHDKPGAAIRMHG